MIKFLNIILTFLLIGACNSKKEADSTSFIGKYKIDQCHFIQPGNRVWINDPSYGVGNAQMTIGNENGKFYIESINLLFKERLPIKIISDNYFIIDTGIIETSNTKIINNGYGIMTSNKIKIRITGMSIPHYQLEGDQPDNTYFPFDITTYYTKQ